MEPAPGKVADARMALVGAFNEARTAGDVEQMAALALTMPSEQRFGAHPGQLPALIHEAYLAAVEPGMRCRLAAALSRAWVYGGDAARGVEFAVEAVDLGDRLGDSEILADALDSALVARWGPDDFSERLQLSAKLADTTAHLSGVEPRLAAHLWGLTTAWECLDVVAVQRQLRALDILAEESGSARVAFFAASRRAMHALVVADLQVADRLIDLTSRLGGQVGEPDVAAVLHSLSASRAQRVGDLDLLVREAESFEGYGASEGIPSVSAEAAVFWLQSGRRDRARELALELTGSGLDGVRRDVDFLLTVTSIVEVAAAVGLDEISADGARLLEPYAGRGVLNAGAVSFHGVVDDYLYRAYRALDDPDATRWRQATVVGYARIGATWWRERAGESAATGRAQIHFYRNAEGRWIIGRDGEQAETADVKGLQYLSHLLRRPGVDVSALDLAAAATGHPAVTVHDTDAGDLVDPQALAAYRARLHDIDAELTEAESWADENRHARLRLEREALLDQVGAATGLAGRRRRFSSSQERARVAVRKAIAAALDRIDANDPALARLLRDTVHTGAQCRYDPDPGRPAIWLLDAPRGDAPRQTAAPDD